MSKKNWDKDKYIEANDWHTLPLEFNKYREALSKARRGGPTFFGEPGFWKFLFQYIEDLNERIERLED